jgi:hypothetical protein
VYTVAQQVPPEWIDAEDPANEFVQVEQDNSIIEHLDPVLLVFVYLFGIRDYVLAAFYNCMIVTNEPAEQNVMPSYRCDT